MLSRSALQPSSRSARGGHELADLSLLLSARDRDHGRSTPTAAGAACARQASRPMWAARRASRAAPPDRSVASRSLGSFVLVRVNPAFAGAEDEQSPAPSAALSRDLTGKGGRLRPASLSGHALAWRLSPLMPILRKPPRRAFCGSGTSGIRLKVKAVAPGAAPCPRRVASAGPGLGRRSSSRSSAGGPRRPRERRDERLVRPRLAENRLVSGLPSSGRDRDRQCRARQQIESAAAAPMTGAYGTR